MVWHRLLFSTGNIVSSLVLGILAMFIVALNFPNAFESILNFAGAIVNGMKNTGLLSTRYNNLLRIIIEEKQIVLMMFVLGVRILTSLVYGIFAKYVLKLED